MKIQSTVVPAGIATFLLTSALLLFVVEVVKVPTTPAVASDATTSVYEWTPPRWSIVPLQRVAPTQLRVERLASRILAVRSSGKTSGELTPALALTIAETITAGCADFDPYMLVGLAWVESGFRPSATLKRPGVPWMLGLLQLNERYVPTGVDPLDPVQAILLGCKKLRYWRDTCKHKHAYLAHWFAGFKVGSRALAAAAKVKVRTRLLKEGK